MFFSWRIFSLFISFRNRKGIWKFSLRKIDGLIAAVINIRFIIIKNTAGKIHQDIRGNIFKKQGSSVADKIISCKMGITGSDIFGILMQADGIIFKGAVRCINPDISKTKKPGFPV